MKKRIMAVLLCVMLLANGSLLLGAAETKRAADSLTIAGTTRMQGNFFTDLWGSNASDADVRALLHDDNLIRWNDDRHVYTANEAVVSGLAATRNEAGEYSFTLALRNDLRYSDGSSITAWDYAFSMLLCASPEIVALGAQSSCFDYLKGGTEYASGKSKQFSGVHVINDYQLRVTLKAEYSTYYFQLGLLSCNPYPIAVIAPSCKVMDDGEGAYIANTDAGKTEPAFTADLLRKTLLDKKTGYRSHPSVVSGPYTLTSFDGTTAKFELNPYYNGNYAGSKPSIRHLVFTVADYDTMIQDLVDGKYDLLTRVSRKDALMEGLEAVVSQQGIATGYYPRTGLSMVAFCCEREAVSSRNVRLAIANCMDRASVKSDYVGGFGTVAEGYYGLGQWVYRIASMVDPYPVADGDTNPADNPYLEDNEDGWDEFSFDDSGYIVFDTDEAAELLEEDGWTLNKNGEKFSENMDDVRCKKVDGKLQPLELTLAYPEGSSIAESFRKYFVPNLTEAGIQLKLKALPMSDLLDQYYGQAERDCDMIFLATNFSEKMDPAAEFITDAKGQHVWRYTRLADENLYDAALSMRNSHPGDVLAYCEGWVFFQKCLNDSMPLIPIYSNVYYDFYTNTLHNYMIAEQDSWTRALFDAYLGEPMEDQPYEPANAKGEDPEDDPEEDDEDDFEDYYEDDFEDDYEEEDLEEFEDEEDLG